MNHKLSQMFRILLALLFSPALAAFAVLSGLALLTRRGLQALLGREDDREAWKRGRPQ